MRCRRLALAMLLSVLSAACGEVLGIGEGKVRPDAGPQSEVSGAAPGDQVGGPETEDDGGAEDPSEGAQESREAGATSDEGDEGAPRHGEQEGGDGGARRDSSVDPSALSEAGSADEAGAELDSGSAQGGMPDVQTPPRAQDACAPGHEGDLCDDGKFCTVSDACRNGVCIGTLRDCGDGIDCNGSETCSDSARACMPGNSSCSADSVCNTSENRCVASCSGCRIGPSCIASGGLNPINPCQVCNLARSASAWSNNDGAPCGSGPASCSAQDTCQAEVCQPNHAGVGSACGQTATACKEQDSCDGAGHCIDRGAKQTGAQCAADADPMTVDTCNAAGLCVAGPSYCDGEPPICWRPAPTGQSRCFNASAQIPCPAGSGAASCASTAFCGQDAQYVDAPRSFDCRDTARAPRACSATSVALAIDSHNAFFWTTKLPANYGAACANSTLGCTFQQASEYCASILIGDTGWRLPDTRELQSLINYGKGATPPTSDLPGMTAGTFWTADAHLAGASHANAVDFATGYAKVLPVSTVLPVHCITGGNVRGALLSNPARFYMLGSAPQQLVLDRATQQLWASEQRASLNWSQALAYCEGLSFGGYSDWRLPAQSEVLTLLDYQKAQAPTSEFPGSGAHDYWSATTYEGAPAWAFTANLDVGIEDRMLKTASTGYARCVRSYP